MWYVVTAAQCQEQGGPGISHVNIRVGEGDEQMFRISEGDVTVHDRFRQKIGQYDNDIALIRLPKRVRITRITQTAFLPFSQSSVARELGVRNLGAALIGKIVTVVGSGFSQYKKDSAGRDTLEFLGDRDRKQHFIEVKH